MNDHDPQASERSRLLAALLIDAVRHRELHGQTTSLRDLHRLLDVPQPLALRLADRLRDEGVVLVEMNDADAFASVVRISRSVANQMDAAKRRRDALSK